MHLLEDGDWVRKPLIVLELHIADVLVFGENPEPELLDFLNSANEKELALEPINVDVFGNDNEENLGLSHEVMKNHLHWSEDDEDRHQKVERAEKPDLQLQEKHHQGKEGGKELEVDLVFLNDARVFPNVESLRNATVSLLLIEVSLHQEEGNRNRDVRPTQVEHLDGIWLRGAIDPLFHRIYDELEGYQEIEEVLEKLDDWVEFEGAERLVFFLDFDEFAISDAVVHKAQPQIDHQQGLHLKEDRFQFDCEGQKSGY